jgi:Tol biopolymer transport system component
MNDLENRIRDEFRDPHWALPVWPDPMPRVRKAARLRLVRQTLVSFIVMAALVTPFAIARSVIGHQDISRRSAIGASPTHERSGQQSSVPTFAKRLGGEVAYLCQEYICLMRPDGTGRRTLTATFPEWDPAWSPDGRRLAFRGYYGPAEGDYDIYTVAANGCQLTRVTHGLNGMSPAWSPGERQIAFVSTGIEVINANGTGLRRLTRDTKKHIDISPSWSASDRVAFVRFHGTAPGQIYTMKADGTAVEQITHGSQGFDHPSWSPSGQEIAFVTDSGTIEVANSDGTGSHAVSPKNWTSSNPTWTPTGKVVFLIDIGSSYVVNPDGGDLRKLYTSLGNVLAGQGQITWGAAILAPQKCSPRPPSA